jgi:hypothetical protein
MPNGNSAVTFNPFVSENVDDIISQVQTVLHEKMGRQDDFFQIEQDNLVRMVIEVQVSLWPKTNVKQFGELVAEPRRFRGLCKIILDCVHPELKFEHSLRFEDDSFETERPYIEAALAQMEPSMRNRVVSSAKMFLEYTYNEQTIRYYKSIGYSIKLTLSKCILA